jgi:hypothetical protein
MFHIFWSDARRLFRDAKRLFRVFLVRGGHTGGY